MQIYHTIEELSFLQDHITDTDLYQIRDMYPLDQWVRAATYFLNGLPQNHHMIGKVVGGMRDICYDFKQSDSLTPKQQIYLVANLIENWHELSYEYRGYVVI